MAIKRSTIIFSVLILLTAAVSILLYAGYGYPRAERIFFFPKDHTYDTVGESRVIPRQLTYEENIEEYVAEWLLGPLVLENRSLFPRDTKLMTLLYREGTLYLDFSMNIMMKSDEAPLNFHEILDVVVHGVEFNFPEVEKVIFTVEGEPVPPVSADL